MFWIILSRKKFERKKGLVAEKENASENENLGFFFQELSCELVKSVKLSTKN